MFHRLRFEIPLFVNENCSSCCVKEYLKQLNSELEKLAEMIHGDTVNEGRRRVFPWLCDAEFAGNLTGNSCSCEQNSIFGYLLG